jgi:hypothetical protein
MKALNLTYNSILIMALGLVLLSFLVPLQTIDLHFHDTYLVMSPLYFYLPIAVLLIVIWLFHYWTAKMVWSNTLSWLHIVLTLVTMVVICILPFSINLLDTSIPWNDFASFSEKQYFFGISILAFIIAQLVFAINLVVGLVKKKH